MNIKPVFTIYINKLRRTGFFHIFTSQLLNKIISFASGILVIRILSKSDYGLYSYANNIISMFLLFSGLGAVSGLLQFGCENINNNSKLRSYSKFAWRIGISFSIIVSIVILLYALFIDTSIKNASNILILMGLIPIFDFACSYMEVNFRIRLQNNIYSVLTSINTLLLMLATVLGAFFLSVVGIIIFRYMAFLITFIIGIYYQKKNNHYSDDVELLAKKEKKVFIQLSLISCINNGTTQLLVLLDVFLVGIMIPNLEIIASYKTATTIPLVMIFIPSVIIMYIYPYFAMNNNNRDWIRQNYYKLLKAFILMNALITIFMYTFAPLIIRLVFGSQYMDSLIPFRILVIGYFISSTFRIPSGNILVSLHHIKINLYNGIISGGLNIVLNIIMIKLWGAIGASISTVCIYVISSLISTIYLNVILKRDTKPLITD